MTEVRLDWLGCATFRLTVGPTVVFLDAYLDRISTAPPVGITTADVDRADWIVVGHSHFDHAYGAETIALRTGAKILGSYETVRIMGRAGVPAEQLVPVSGGERVRLGPDLAVRVLPSIHSCLWAKNAGQANEACFGDLDVLQHERDARLGDMGSWISALGPEVREHLHGTAQGALGDGGALLFLFETPEGSVLYQDTSGHWSGILEHLRPDVAILAAAGRGNVDGEPTQGSLAQFVARETELLQPRRVLLGHHDDWMPGFSVPLDPAPIRAELAARLPNVDFLEMGYLENRPVLSGL
jgi:L-ascorbate metabolism protein UlaG (beta-lactamase superfamily)